MAKEKKAAKKKKPAKKAAKKNNVPANQPAAARGATENIAVEKTALDTLYIVNSSANNVSLEVKVGGKEQTGDMTIMLEEQVVAENLAGDFAETVLGTNRQLNGKRLSIVATIADTSRETNFTSLTVFLKGGFSDENYFLAKTVAAEGASADYMCLIEFFKP